MTSTVRAALGLGSNLGDRVGHLGRAVAGLARETEVDDVSSIYESAPVGYEDQPDFLNAVVTVRTQPDLRSLLRIAHRLEDEAGRERPFPDAPRTLDVDILLARGLTVADEELRVPHPRFRERAFVLAPLAEVAGGWVDPESGRTVEEIRRSNAPSLPPVTVYAPPSALRRYLP